MYFQFSSYLSPNIHVLFIPYSLNFLPGPRLFGEMVAYISQPFLQLCVMFGFEQLVIRRTTRECPCRKRRPYLHLFLFPSEWYKGWEFQKPSSPPPPSPLYLKLSTCYPRTIMEYELNFLVIRALYYWFGRTPKMLIYCSYSTPTSLQWTLIDGEPFPGNATSDFPLVSSTTDFKTTFLECFKIVSNQTTPLLDESELGDTHSKLSGDMISIFLSKIWTLWLRKISLICKKKKKNFKLI